jgi:hypothetical protein
MPQLKLPYPNNSALPECEGTCAVVRCANLIYCHPSYRIRASVVFVLLIIWNWEIRRLVGLQCHNVHTEFRENWLNGTKLEIGGYVDILPTEHNLGHIFHALIEE